jgi:4-diphosphocytidyl-2-C-methyl-D-erythritol kinase
MKIVLDARAKLNLGLEIVRKRPDGYHEIRSLMQTIELSDRLVLRPGSNGLVRLRIDDRRETGGRGRPPRRGTERGATQHLAGGEDNLVVRAARLLQSRTRCRKGARITLIKRIPVGAGLGGGSSDAAAVLRGLNRLWGLRLPQTELIRLAADLGSDVPFFIRGGLQLARGRGEKLTPLPPLPRFRVAVIDPSLFVSTASIYKSPKLRLTPIGPLTRLHACDLTSRFEVLSCIAHLHNGLEPAVQHRAPRVARILRDCRALGSEVVRVTGSGSCVFVLAGDPKALDRLQGEASVRGCRVHMTRFVGRGSVSVVPRGA